MTFEMNIAASVKARLLNEARKSGRPFNDLLQLYAIERFLYRLSCSNYCSRFVLKGALMFIALKMETIRPTRDIDLLGYTPNDVEKIVELMQEICSQQVEPDGLFFDPETVRGLRINEDADYQGVRVKLTGTLGEARIPMQIDIGFADPVWPAPMEIDYPTILPQPGPHLRGYPLESIIAEKLQAMVYLGSTNSRMKDFYDLWTLSNEFDFDGHTLSEALIQTFAHRGTPVPTGQPAALSDAFIQDKQLQWQAFIRRMQLGQDVTTLEQVIVRLRKFLLPVTEAAATQTVFPMKWKANQDWVVGN